MRTFLFSMGILLVAVGWKGGARAETFLPLESGSFTLLLGSDARVRQFIDSSSGVDYRDPARSEPFAILRTLAGTFPADSAHLEADLLTVRFSGCEGAAVLRVTPRSRAIDIEVASLACEGAEELRFGIVPLTLKGSFDEPFAASPLALNLQTNCHQIPGLSSDLTGFVACKKFGFIGAAGAILACETDHLREALQEILLSSPDLPSSPLGGPWALEAPVNQGSYLIAMEEPVTESNVDEWIAAAQACGASQIDLHGGKPFRWGDYEVNREIYPRGRESLEAVVEAIHKAGLAAGLHTYAFFIAKDSPWVTPVPDPRLATAAVFTLSEDISETSETLPVTESTESISPTTGFQVRNSATVRIGDELITFTSVNQQPPYGFTECVRGAYGTRVANHSRGETVHHLKECFGLFVPEGDSSLFLEVAQRTADLYNECGFDMLYLDALDGSDILAGGLNGWHYEAKFVDELMRHLKKPPVMEMSTFSHHLWRARSRMQAWDCARRGVKNFVDCHVLHNRQWKAAFLPTHLGWWANFDWNGIQPERTFPDDLEYVCTKALATDSSLSFLVGFSPDQMRGSNGKRLAGIAHAYETLRREGVVAETLKARLAEPGQDFSLELSDSGEPLFRHCLYSQHRLREANSPQDFRFTNPYPEQPFRFRIEVGLSPRTIASDEARFLADFSSAEIPWTAKTQTGVTAELLLPKSQSAGSESSALLKALNSGGEKNRAWAEFRQEFSTPLDLSQKGLGLWVEGDGQGEVLNIQLRSPDALGGGFADHTFPVDFTGRRYLSLIEPDSDALGQFEWSHTRLFRDLLKNPAANMMTLYSMYHIWVNYQHISSLTIGVNNLPEGVPVELRIGPIQALALEKKSLADPVLELNGSQLRLPVEIESGQYLEFLSSEKCLLYDSLGEIIGAASPEGDLPMVREGLNVCRFQSGDRTDTVGNANITVVLSGEPLAP
jgi:hypothetical protein